MEVEYVLTADDVVAHAVYCMEHDNRSWGGPQWRKWIFFMLSVGLLFMTLVLGAPMDVDGPEWAVVKWIGIVVAPFFFLGWIAYARRTWRKGVARQIRKELEHPDSASALGGYRFRIGPEGLTVIREQFTATTKWGAVEEIALTEDHAFFFTGETAAHVLPRRPFATEEDFKAFIAAARQYRKAARKGGAQDASPRGEEDDRIKLKRGGGEIST